MIIAQTAYQLQYSSSDSGKQPLANALVRPAPWSARTTAGSGQSEQISSRRQLAKNSYDCASSSGHHEKATGIVRLVLVAPAAMIRGRPCLLVRKVASIYKRLSLVNLFAKGIISSDQKTVCRSFSVSWLSPLIALIEHRQPASCRRSNRAPAVLSSGTSLICRRIRL